MDHRISVIQDFSQFQALAPEWDRMVGEKLDHHPFFSHFWFATYYSVYFPHVPLMVLTDGSNGAVAGAFPAIVSRRRLAGIPLHTAQLLAGDHTPENRILVGADQQELLGGFLEKLLEQKLDLIYLEDLPESFPDQAWMTEFCRKRELALEIRKVRLTPYIPSLGKFDDYRKTLSKKFRENLNNRLNRINRAGGFAITIFSGPNEAERALQEMRLIASQSWQGKEGSGLFSGEKNAAFYPALIRHSLAHGYGRVHILHFQHRPAAFEFHILHGRTEYCLKAEFAHEFAHVSPGAVLELELVKQAFASDIETYDLLGYDDPYKMRWTAHCAPYFRYFIFGRTAMAKMAHTLYFRLGDCFRTIKHRNRHVATAPPIP